MRSFIHVLAFVATSALSATGSSAGEPVQPPAMVVVVTNSPTYILITVVDDRTATSRTTCTTDRFLSGALHREYGLGFTPENSARIDKMVAENHARVFHFTKQDALDNMSMSYSEADLAAARAALAPLSAQELRAIFSSHDSSGREAFDRFPHRVIACALVERGFSPSQADRSGQIYVNP